MNIATTTKKTIIIADDHPLFRASLCQLIAGIAPDAECLEVSSLSSLQAALEGCRNADLVLLDLQMPGTSGFTGLVFLREHHPDVPVLVMSASDDEDIQQRVAHFGASGLLAKTAPVEQVKAAITALCKGVSVGLVSDWDDLVLSTDELVFAERLATLTPKQFRVLMMLAEGLLNKQIAYELNVSEATIKAHVTAILRKLEVTSRTQAVIETSRLGMPVAAS